MKRILFWLLPVADVFALQRILWYYRFLGVEVPLKHARIGAIERWIGYLPLGLISGWFLGFWMALLVLFIISALVGPIELYLMCRGAWPWKFLKHKPSKLITKIFLLEVYNFVGYYTLGILFALLIGI